MYEVSAWWDAYFYSDRERAALAWTEAVTRIEGRVSDDVFEEAKKHFTDKELVKLRSMSGIGSMWLFAMWRDRTNLVFAN